MLLTLLAAAAAYAFAAAAASKTRQLEICSTHIQLYHIESTRAKGCTPLNHHTRIFPWPMRETLCHLRDTLGAGQEEQPASLESVKIRDLRILGLKRHMYCRALPFSQNDVICVTENVMSRSYCYC
jgi:hypothetical protein